MIWWTCSCGQLRTLNAQQAFLHRTDESHSVKPLTDYEFKSLPQEQARFALAGIERQEITDAPYQPGQAVRRWTYQSETRSKLSADELLPVLTGGNRRTV